MCATRFHRAARTGRSPPRREHGQKATTASPGLGVVRAGESRNRCGFATARRCRVQRKPPPGPFRASHRWAPTEMGSACESGGTHRTISPLTLPTSGPTRALGPKGRRDCRVGEGWRRSVAARNDECRLGARPLREYRRGIHTTVASAGERTSVGCAHTTIRARSCARCGPGPRNHEQSGAKSSVELARHRPEATRKNPLASVERRSPRAVPASNPRRSGSCTKRLCFIGRPSG